MSKKKILICEDNEVERKAIQLAAARLHVETFLASDGRQALKQLEENEFDLVITDIHMPYHNGDEILERIRAKSGRSVPVVMISSDNQEEVVKMALRQGVDSFIEKPIDPDMVSSLLRKYLQQSQP